MPLPTKPVKLPRWGDNLADPSDIVEPLAGKKDIGWQDAELPPHSYMNWLFNLIYLWTAWLDSLTDQALTWTAAHIFQAGMTISTGAAVALSVIQTAGFDGMLITGHGNVGGKYPLHIKTLLADGGGANTVGLQMENDTTGTTAVFGNTGGGKTVLAQANGVTVIEAQGFNSTNTTDGTAPGAVVGQIFSAPSTSWQAGVIGRTALGGETSGVMGVATVAGANIKGARGGRFVGAPGGAGNADGGVGVLATGGVKTGSGMAGVGLQATVLGDAAAIWAQGLGTDLATEVGPSPFSSPEVGQWAGLIATAKNHGADGGYGLIVAGDAGAAKRAALKIILQQTFPTIQTLGDVCAPITGAGVDTGKLYCSEGGYGFLPIGGRAKLMADGEITLNGTAAPTFIGQNIAGVAIGASIVTVTFTNPMHMAPRVQITLGDELGATLYHARTLVRTTAVFTFKIRDNTGALIDPAVVGTGLKIDFACSTY